MSHRCKDANQHEPAKAVVRAVSFHPTGELLLAGGFDKTLRMFQVKHKLQRLLSGMFFFGVMVMVTINL